MSLNVVRLYGDDDGETHFTNIEIPTDGEPSASGVTSVAIPTARISYVEYPADLAEVNPGFNATAAHLVVCLRGGFEVTTTTGETKSFGPGDWFFCDDAGSKGHRTRTVGSEGRVNLAISFAPGYTLPGT